MYVWQQLCLRTIDVVQFNVDNQYAQKAMRPVRSMFLATGLSGACRVELRAAAAEKAAEKAMSMVQEQGTEVGLGRVSICHLHGDGRGW